MKDIRGWSRSIAYAIVIVFFAFAGGIVSADPPQSVKTLSIPVSMLKDIQRVRPGMTRADLDWLFRPQGGMVAIGSNQNTYVYRYGEVGVTGFDAHGQPIIDQNTHHPVLFGAQIKIDVTFKLGGRYIPPTGTVSGKMGTSDEPSDNDGLPEDVITRISSPYLGGAIDN